MIEHKWYTRDGVPMVEVKETRGTVVCALSNEFIEDTDIEITESEYETLVAAAKAEIEQARQDAIAAFQARQSEIETQKIAIKAKLMSGDPLTDEEADIVLMTLS